MPMTNRTNTRHLLIAVAVCALVSVTIWWGIYEFGKMQHQRGYDAAWAQNCGLSRRQWLDVLRRVRRRTRRLRANFAARYASQQDGAAVRSGSESCRTVNTEKKQADARE